MNVVLVDDELQIQSWLQLMLEKTQCPIHLKGVFANGREALAYCLEHEVDLVVTDIRMPIMDGLELIRQLKTERPHVRFLILSAYEEFHYASEGMRLGASDYLLKAEITVEDLQQALKRIQNDIDNSRRAGEELNSMRWAINENQMTLRHKYLKELAEGEQMAVLQFKHKQQFLSIELENQYLVVFAIGFEQREFAHAIQRFQSKELLELAIVNVIDDTLGIESGKGNAFPMDEALFAVAINVPNTGSKSIRERTFHYASRIVSNVFQYLKIHAAIGISDMYGDVSCMKQQWQEATQALRHYLFYGRQAIIMYQDLLGESRGLNQDHMFSNLYEEAISQLQLDHYSGFQHSVNQLIREIEAKKHWTENQVKSIFQEIVYMMRRKLLSLSVPLPESFSYVMIQEEPSFQECKAWLMRYIDAFMEQTSWMKRSSAVIEICRYVAKNYKQDISLQEVSDRVHLNKTYVSGLFKKEMGITFYEYLTEHRINRAKELMATNNDTIGELAEKVGYPNASHFTKVFKKITGVSPMEYKKMHAQSELKKTIAE